MRATIIALVLLAGCTRHDPTAEDFARAKAYCEHNGMRAVIVEPFPPGVFAVELLCAPADGNMGTVSIPAFVFAKREAP